MFRNSGEKYSSTLVVVWPTCAVRVFRYCSSCDTFNIQSNYSCLKLDRAFLFYSHFLVITQL